MKQAHPRKNAASLQKEIDRTLIDFVYEHVSLDWEKKDGSIPEELKLIAGKPSWTVV